MGKARHRESSCQNMKEDQRCQLKSLSTDASPSTVLAAALILDRRSNETQGVDRPHHQGDSWCREYQFLPTC